MATSIIKVRKIIFNTSINPRQINRFRGAIIEKARSENVLFHNHLGDGFLRKYPLIQYKILDGKVGVLAINEGATAVNDLIDKYDYKLDFDGLIHDKLLFTDTTMPFEFGVTKQTYRYYMPNWAPLNSESLKDFTALPSDDERAAKLQSLLIKNLINMCNRLGIATRLRENQISAQVHKIESSGTINMHQTPLYKFKVRFSCNVLLPADVGLGRATAFGAGCVKVGR